MRLVSLLLVPQALVRHLRWALEAPLGSQPMVKQQRPVIHQRSDKRPLQVQHLGLDKPLPRPQHHLLVSQGQPSAKRMLSGRHSLLVLVHLVSPHLVKAHSDRQPRLALAARHSGSRHRPTARLLVSKLLKALSPRSIRQHNQDRSRTHSVRRCLSQTRLSKIRLELLQSLQLQHLVSQVHSRLELPALVDNKLSLHLLRHKTLLGKQQGPLLLLQQPSRRLVLKASQLKQRHRQHHSRLNQLPSLDPLIQRTATRKVTQKSTTEKQANCWKKCIDGWDRWADSTTTKISHLRHQNVNGLCLSPSEELDRFYLAGWKLYLSTERAEGMAALIRQTYVEHHRNTH